MKSITKKNKKLTKKFKVNKPVKATTLKKSPVIGNLLMLAEQARRRKPNSSPSGGGKRSRRDKRSRRGKRNRRGKRSRRGRKLIAGVTPPRNPQANDSVVLGDADRCPICSDDFEDVPGEILPCQHKMHRHCLDNWRMAQKGNIYQNVCPICKKPSSTVSIPSGPVKPKRPRSPTGDAIPKRIGF